MIITCDLQLFKIAAQNEWNQPKKFEKMTIRLGRMHLLMSFLGCIGFLMKGKGKGANLDAFI